MILQRHGVFLGCLLLLLAWNAVAGGRGWERRLLLPLQVVLVAVLVRDRLFPGELSLLNHPVVRWCFPAAFVLAVAQNVVAIRARGARLTDIPIVLANVGLGACVGLAAAVLGGATTGEREGALLYDACVLQQLLGTPLAYFHTLSWQLPVLAPRRTPSSVPGLLAGLFVPALCGFMVLMLVIFHTESERVLVLFHLEPELAAGAAGAADAPARTALQRGVLARGDDATALAAPGNLDAWVLPADHDGAGLAAPRRPLVLALVAPDRWSWSLPDHAEVAAAFLDGAERLARQLQPAVLLPFPEPDGEATLLFGPDESPAEWRRLLLEAQRRVRAVSPGTRLAARLAGTGERSHELFAALAADPPAADILGPRLQPGGSEKGGPALADATLATWQRWRREVAQPPALWVLAAGLSPLAYGDWAQTQFVAGCLQRAAATPDVQGILFEGWTDRGHTLGLQRADGSLRPAGERLTALLSSLAEANR